METGDNAANTQMEGRIAIKLIQEKERRENGGDGAKKSSRKVVMPVS